MKDCKIVQDLLPLYADELTSVETGEFIEKHLESCGECRAIRNRCAEPIPQTEGIDEKQLKKAMRRDARKMAWSDIRMFALIFLVPTLIMAGIILYHYWDSGALAPVELATSAYSEVFGGEMTVEVIDRDQFGQKYRGAGSIICTRIEDSSLSYHNDSWITCWENVRIDWAPNGTHRLFTAQMPDGRTDYFVIAYDYELDETGGWIKERLFPKQPDDVWYPNYADGLTAILTQYCRENRDIPQDWNEIEFTFHTWSPDSNSAEFYYTTDTGLIGTVWYSIVGQESTGMWAMAYAATQVAK